MNLSDLKQQTIQLLSNRLEERHASLSIYANELQKSLENESKNSAGDKHETGRAMLHLEQEKIQHQWNEIKELSIRLKRLNTLDKKEVIGLGSFIETEGDYFFIGVGLGKQIIEDKIVYCVALEAPIGQQLIGKKVGEMILFNGFSQKIKAIA
jgi:transcription elongation GreA/GreB family factor